MPRTYYTTHFWERVPDVAAADWRWMADQLRRLRAGRALDWTPPADVLATQEPGFRLDRDGDAVLLAAVVLDPAVLVAAGVDTNLRGGHVESALAFLTAYLERSRRRDGLVLRWSNLSDPPVPGGFGGGAAVVTRRGVRASNTEHWLTMRRARDVPAPTTIPPGWYGRPARPGEELHHAVRMG